MLDVNAMWQQSTSTTVVLGRHLLRHAVCLVLVDACGPLSVAEIVEHLRRRGYATLRTPSRAVSDALRTEVRSGRAERVERGVYRALRVDRPHLRHVRRCLAEVRRHPTRRWATGTPWEVRHQRWLTRVSDTIPPHGVHAR
jgi:hypothetical protein